MSITRENKLTLHGEPIEYVTVEKGSEGIKFGIQSGAIVYVEGYDIPSNYGGASVAYIGDKNFSECLENAIGSLALEDFCRLKHEFKGVLDLEEIKKRIEEKILEKILREVIS